MRHRFEGLVLTMGLAVAATGAARAQHPGHHDGAGMQAALLTNRGVQKELKLDKGQADGVARLAAHVAAKGKAGAKEFAALPEAERRAKMHALMTAACDEAMTRLREILQPEQYTRFEQIALQQRGLMAFADPAVREKLKLSSEQDARLHELAAGLHDQVRELSKDASPGKMAEVHEQGLALGRKAMDRAVASLSAEQKATWKELTGEPFEVKFEGHPGH